MNTTDLVVTGIMTQLNLAKVLQAVPAILCTKVQELKTVKKEKRNEH